MTTTVTQWHRPLGVFLLGVLLSGSYVSVFVAIYLTSENQADILPVPFQLWPMVAFAGSLCFPIFLMHLNATIQHKHINWVSYVLIAFLLLAVGLWVNALLVGNIDAGRPDGPEAWYGDYIRWVATGYSFCMMSGFLGCFAFLAVARRFAPRWLKIHAAESRRIQFTLGTTLFWVFTSGVIFAAFENFEGLLLEWPANSAFGEFVLATLFASTAYGIISFLCLSWLNHAKPLWLASVSMVVLGCAFPVAISVSLEDFSRDPNDIATVFDVCLLLSSVGVLLSVWIVACRWSGLIIDVEPQASTGNWKRGLRIFRRAFNYSIFGLTTVLCLAAAWWYILHFIVSSSERDPDYVRQTLAEGLGIPADSQCSLSELYDDRRGAKIAASDNLAFDLWPMLDQDPENETWTRQIQSKIGVMTETQSKELHNVPPMRWSSKRNLEKFEAYRRQLKKNHDFLRELGQYENFSDCLPVDANREQLIAAFAYQRFSLYYAIGDVPWTEADFPVAAEYVEANIQYLEYLRRNTKTKSFYAPFIKIVNDDTPVPVTLIWPSSARLMHEPIRLLAASAYYHIGKGDFGVAIDDFETLSILIEHDIKSCLVVDWHHPDLYVAVQVAESIVRAKSVSASQLSELLRAQIARRDPFENTNEQLMLKKAYWFDCWLQANDGNFDFVASSENSVSEFLRNRPGMVNWASFDREINRFFEGIGDIDKKTDGGRKNRSAFDEFEKKFAYVVKGRQVAVNNIECCAPNQLLALMKGPVAKGEWMGKTVAAAIANSVSIGQLFRYRTEIAMGETATALEIYQRKNGRYPNRLELLVPDVLPKLKLDPYSGDPLIYTLKKDGYSLYSVGHNQVDDGGNDESDVVHGNGFVDLVEYIEFHK